MEILLHTGIKYAHNGTRVVEYHASEEIQDLPEDFCMYALKNGLGVLPGDEMEASDEDVEEEIDPDDESIYPDELDMEPHILKVGHGKYNVMNEKGECLNGETPLRKKQADQMLAEYLDGSLDTSE